MSNKLYNFLKIGKLKYLIFYGLMKTNLSNQIECIIQKIIKVNVVHIPKDSINDG